MHARRQQQPRSQRHTRCAALLCALICLPFSACKDTYVSSIPDTAVYLSLNLTSNSDYFIFYNNPGSYLAFTDDQNPNQHLSDRLGYGGLLLVHGLSGDFYAYDLACPKEAKRSVRVNPSDAMFATCPECGETYDVSFGVGSPTRKISRESLRTYRIRLNANSLVVTRE